VARCIDLKDFGREIDTVARPGGFTTGVTYFSPGATRRRLELLKELVPNLSRVGVLYQPESSWMRSRRRRGPPASASSVWNGNPPRIPAARSTSRSSDAWAR
jgi:hypothetical protein